MTAFPLILASGSPRRRDLLAEAGLAFEVCPANVEEIEDPGWGIEALVSQNARLKCQAVAQEHPDAVVLGADTLVALDGEPLGKPTDLDHAFAMLSRMVGKTHEVCTGVCLHRHRPQYAVEFMERTLVTFKPLNASEIHSYLSLIDPLDKAGSYAAQDYGERIIERTEGSWTNVVGLPMERLLEHLRGLS